MRRTTVSQTGTGNTAVVPVDQYTDPVNIGLGITVSGTVNCTVQHTFDDVFAANYNPATGTWFDHYTLNGVTTSAYGDYDFPISAIRLKVNSGSGTASLSILQAGITT